MHEVQMLESLEGAVASLREKMQSVVNALDADTLPSPGLINEISAGMAQAWGIYRDLLGRLEDSPDIDLSAGVSVQTARDALAKFISDTEIQKKVEYTKQVLGEFLLLRSDVKRYETVLDELRQNVAALTDAQVEQIATTDALAAYETFLRAVKGDVYEDEVEEKIIPVFGDSLALALAMKKIEFGLAAIPEVAEDEIAEAAPVEIAAEVPVKAVEAVEAVEAIEAEEAEEVIAEPVAEAAEVEAEAAEAVEEPQVETPQEMPEAAPGEVLDEALSEALDEALDKVLGETPKEAADETPDEALETHADKAAAEEEQDLFEDFNDNFSDNLSENDKDKDLDLGEDNPFTAFINPDNYSSFEELCKKNGTNALKAIAADFVEKNIEKEKLRDSARELLSNLPNSTWSANASGIKTMLQELGFKVYNVDKTKHTYTLFTAKVNDDNAIKELNKHPAVSEDNKLSDEVQVIELLGGMETDAIVSAVQKFKMQKMPIVLLNGYITLAQRKQLAKLFLKDVKEQTPFILVDWVLLLHLALQAKEDRIGTMLACAVPFNPQ